MAARLGKLGGSPIGGRNPGAMPNKLKGRLEKRGDGMSPGTENGLGKGKNGLIAAAAAPVGVGEQDVTSGVALLDREGGGGGCGGGGGEGSNGSGVDMDTFEGRPRFFFGGDMESNVLAKCCSLACLSALLVGESSLA